MSGLKLIRRRIASVKNTRQITRAIKLVSAAKLRKIHDVVLHSRDYVTELERILKATSAFLSASFTHPLLKPNPEATIRRVYVIAGDRGLCGSYNANILKTVQRLENDTSSTGFVTTTEFVTIGRRAAAYAKRAGWNVVATLEGLSDDPSTWLLDEIFSNLEQDFRAGRLAQAVVYYAEFISAMSQHVKMDVILPFACPVSVAHSINATGADPREDEVLEPTCRFSPNADSIFSETISMMFRAKFLQFALEGKTSEHAARMTAMDSATNNADDIIDKLKLHYNRARQSAITRELIDIVGGAQAIK